MIEKIDVYRDLEDNSIWVSTLVRTVSFRYTDIETGPRKFGFSDTSTSELGAFLRAALNNSVDEYPNPGGSKDANFEKNAKFDYKSPVLEPMGCKSWKEFDKRFILALVSRNHSLYYFAPTYRKPNGNEHGKRFGDIESPSDEELAVRTLEALDRSK